MKTFLILVLSLSLLAAAFLTRPGKREFVLYLLDAPTAAGSAWSGSAVEHAERVSKDVTIKDYYLWVDVEKDGKVLYTGLFSHWVPRGEKAEKPMPSVAELARLIGGAGK